MVANPVARQDRDAQDSNLRKLGQTSPGGKSPPSGRRSSWSLYWLAEQWMAGYRTPARWYSHPTPKVRPEPPSEHGRPQTPITKPTRLLERKTGNLASCSPGSGHHSHEACVHFAALSSSSPRSFSIGSIPGSFPSHALYIAPSSSVLPRDNTICRNRSPLARVMPPLSSNH